MRRNSLYRYYVDSDWIDRPVINVTSRAVVMLDALLHFLECSIHEPELFWIECVWH